MVNGNTVPDDKARILKAMRFMRKAHPLRQQAALILAERRAKIEEIQPIISPFLSTSALLSNEQEVASWIISNADLSSDQRKLISNVLSGFLSEGMNNKEAGPSVVIWIFRALLICMLFTWTWTDMGDTYRSDTDLLAIIVCSIVGPTCWFYWSDQRRKRQLAALVRSVGDLGFPESISSVARAYRYGPLRDSAGRGLQQLTANLFPEHYGALRAQTIPSLAEALLIADESTTLVILKALTCIGDGRAINAVERLAQRPHTPEIGEAVTALLPILRQRDEESRSQSQLLRAGEVPETADQELVRPAASTNDAEPELLLRASGRGKEQE